MRLDVALSLSLQIAPNSQLALLADQKTRMASLGEVDLIVTLGSVQMRMRALIMKNLQAECFGGTTFHADNDIETRIKTGTIKVHGRFLLSQSNPLDVKQIFPPPSEQVISPKSNDPHRPPFLNNTPEDHATNNLHSISLPSTMVAFPSDCLPIPLPTNARYVSHISITPSFPSAYENTQ